MKRLTGLLVCLTFFLSGTAHATIYAGLDLFYWSNMQDNGTTQITTTDTFPTFTLGWSGTTPLFLGLTYNAWGQTTATSPGSTTTTNLTDYGPTIGYLSDTWHIFGTYLYSATFSSTTSTTTTYTGNGIQLDIGYHMHLGSSFILGPSILYVSRTYTNQTAPTSQPLAKSLKQTDLLPFINLAFVFR